MKNTLIVRYHSIDSHTLFDQDSLAFEINELPATFTKFRKIIESVKTETPISKITHLPASTEY